MSEQLEEDGRMDLVCKLTAAKFAGKYDTTTDAEIKAYMFMLLAADAQTLKRELVEAGFNIIKVEKDDMETTITFNESEQ